MKPFCCFLLALAFFAAIPGMAAPTSTPPHLTKDSVNRDELILSELCALPVNKILKANDQTWVLAKVIPHLPKDQKTHYYFPNDPATGKTSQTPVVDMRFYNEGTFEVKAALTPKTIPSEEYAFPQVPGNTRSMSLGRVVYSSLRLSGDAICQVNLNADGEERYSPVYFVPAEWQAFVAPAFAFCRANPTLFSDTDTRMTAARRTRLTALLTSPNPYLAAFACRTLTRAAAVDPETVDMALSQPDPFRQAVMTYLLLANVPQGDNATATVVEGSIHAITNAADTLDGLNGIALGIGAALETSGGPALWGARDDLAEVQKRLASDAPGDAYISALLHGHERTDK